VASRAAAAGIVLAYLFKPLANHEEMASLNHSLLLGVAAGPASSSISARCQREIQEHAAVAAARAQ
jgi:hypothetical protein